MRINAVLGAWGAVGLVLAGLAVPSSAAQAGVVACTNAELNASYHATDAGMGHRYGKLVLRNVSDHACRTGGYGGLSYVGGGDGTQIGAPADRDPSRVRTIVLQPGQKAVSAVSETDATLYPRHKCRPAKVDGFRVYVPNETRSQFVKHRTIGCRNHRVHLISHKAYRRP